VPFPTSTLKYPSFESKTYNSILTIAGVYNAVI
jgi:hypothetical protein